MQNPVARAKKKRLFIFNKQSAVQISHKMWLAIEENRFSDGIYWRLALVKYKEQEEPEIIVKTLVEILEKPSNSILLTLTKHLKSNRSSLREAIRNSWSSLYHLAKQLKQKNDYLNMYPLCVGRNQKRAEKAIQNLKQAKLMIPKQILVVASEQNWGRDLSKEEQQQLELVDSLFN